MFVIAYNNSVILGPMRWNRIRFQNEIFEECEVQATLPDRNDNNDVIVVNEEIKIYPVKDADGPGVPFNPKIQILDGPFWEFTTTHAIRSYEVLPKPIDLVKGELKNIVAAERWKKEISGTKVTIQGIEVTVDTNRGDRDIFVQKFLLMGENDTVTWKFPETWLNLTKSELGQIVNAGAVHVQQSFEWEATLVNQIEFSTTLEELDAIVIVEPETRPEFPNFPLGE